MVDTPFTLVLTLLAQSYAGNLVKQINRRSALLNVLGDLGLIRQGSGKNWGWGAQSSGAVAETYTDGADVANMGSDTQTSATMHWGLYRGNLHVTGTAQRASATAESPMANRMLWLNAIDDGIQQLTSLINQDLYDGNGSSPNLAGLDMAIGDASNTYATIVRGSAAYWRPTVSDPGALTALSKTQIRGDLSAIGIASGFKPDLALCHPDVFNAILALFDDNRRTNEEAYLSLQGRRIVLEGGADVVRFGNCNFVEDKDATANWIYYCNTQFMEFRYLPPSMPAEAQAILREVRARDGVAEIPLGMEFQYLAKNGDSDRGSAVMNGNLIIKRPNAFGVRKNVQV